MNFIKKLLILIIFLSLFFSCTNEMNLWKFKNSSTHPVLVSKIQNSNEDPFVLNYDFNPSDNIRGESKLIAINSIIEINFEYSAFDLTADVVKAVMEENLRTITFLNK